MMRRLISLPHILPPASILPIALLISACDPADNEPGPGGVSVGEARALDEAAEKVEARRFPLPGEVADAEKQAQEDNRAAQDQPE